MPNEKVELGRIPLQLAAACWSSSGLVGIDRCVHHATAHELELLVGPSGRGYWTMGLASRAH
ncbi:unnamed protein product [Prunus armeniaca]